jgi:hypothetical protein
VVDSGKPTCEAERITAEPAPCAAKPWAGSILMIRVPIVRMMRQPPAYVPSAIAEAAETTTHVGTSSVARASPLATRARKMIPIVFWASLVPCESENRLPDTICPRRKPRLTGPGRCRPTIR